MKTWTMLLALTAAAFPQDVADTPHNLSTSGPGTIRSNAESEICIFCHAPHNSRPQAPLWNRRDPGGTYAIYTSSTLKVSPGQPSGASRLCLSCHDGTIAMGDIVSRTSEIPMLGNRTMPPGRSLLGLDLSDDHPISFSYAASLALKGSELVASPAQDGRSLLDAGGDMQCTACHDPHDNRRGKFLRVDRLDGGLCLQCHQPAGWTGSAHATSLRTWNGAGTDPWPRSNLTTVAANACGSCHTSHAAPGKFRLLKSALEEEVCLACHNGNVASKDIGAELSKWTAHDPSAKSGVHDPAETPDGRRTHVECADCHNPHRTGSAGGGLPAALAGVSGLSASGSPVNLAAHEYEICLKCHADSSDSNPDRIPRVATEPSIRLLFDPSNPSYHPIEAPGKNPDVPSLKSPWTTASLVTCTDCHNNDSGPGAGGAGPRGPHGSRWEFLLERRYDTPAGSNAESASAYALCYKCHERASILADQSFKEHKKHIQGARAACSACHAPHGIDSAQGTATGNSHLINFDTRVVSANMMGKLEFVDQGRFKGTCSLRCHGKNHKNKSYSPR